MAPTPPPQRKEHFSEPSSPNRHEQVVGSKARPSLFFYYAAYVKRGVGGKWRGSAGNEPPECFEALRASAASALTLTAAALSSLLWDVLNLLRLGLMRTFLLEGECGNMASRVRPDSEKGVLISAE